MVEAAEGSVLNAKAKSAVEGDPPKIWTNTVTNVGRRSDLKSTVRRGIAALCSFPSCSKAPTELAPARNRTIGPNAWLSNLNRLSRNAGRAAPRPPPTTTL
eukprot:3802888-Prymnesium_polylepis.2